MKGVTGTDILTWDIECANVFDNRGKICEIGWVLTDEHFRVLDEQLLRIHRQAPFDWYVLKNILAFKKQDYLASPTYPEVFPRIAELFSRPDTAFCGYAAIEDADYLNDEARRFSLPFFSYRFFDLRRVYAARTGSRKNQRLGDVCRALGVDTPERSHCSLDDAKATMRVAEALCQVSGCTFPELMAAYPQAVGMTADGRSRASLPAARRRPDRETQGEGRDT